MHDDSTHSSLIHLSQDAYPQTEDGSEKNGQTQPRIQAPEEETAATEYEGLEIKAHEDMGRAEKQGRQVWNGRWADADESSDLDDDIAMWRSDGGAQHRRWPSCDGTDSSAGDRAICSIEACCEIPDDAA